MNVTNKNNYFYFFIIVFDFSFLSEINVEGKSLLTFITLIVSWNEIAKFCQFSLFSTFFQLSLVYKGFKTTSKSKNCVFVVFVFEDRFTGITFSHILFKLCASPWVCWLKYWCVKTDNSALTLMTIISIL